jgi:Domain of unknown function (DUF4365)
MHDRVPKEWIIRQVTERDYGVDCYIELPNTKGEVTGELLSVQLKGVSTLDWPEDGEVGNRIFKPVLKAPLISLARSNGCWLFSGTGFRITHERYAQ